MFRVMRKILVMLFLLALGGIGYHYLSNPAYQRQLLQKAEEVREQLQEEKSFAWSGSAVVVEVFKGDTIRVNTETHSKVIVRLAGIDAPELPRKFTKEPGQPLAEESRQLLTQLVKNKAVTMDIVGTDFAQRPLVLLTLDGVLINAKIAEAGLAESVEEHMKLLPAKTRHAILNAEYQAKQNRLGIWGLTNYQRPSEYRIRHRKEGS